MGSRVSIICRTLTTPLTKVANATSQMGQLFLSRSRKTAVPISLKLLTSYHYTTERTKMASVIIAVFCDKMLMMIIGRI